MSHWKKKYKESTNYKLEPDDFGYIAWLENQLNKRGRLNLPGYDPNGRTSVIRKPMKLSAVK